jgi:hypothetical protein
MGAPYADTAEVYPTRIRATGMGTACGMSRIAGSLAPTVGGLLLPVSLVAALSVYALGFLAGGLAVFAGGQETRGRPLADTVREPRSPVPAERRHIQEASVGAKGDGFVRVPPDTLSQPTVDGAVSGLVLA